MNDTIIEEVDPTLLWQYMDEKSAEKLGKLSSETLQAGNVRLSICWIDCPWQASMSSWKHYVVVGMKTYIQRLMPVIFLLCALSFSNKIRDTRPKHKVLMLSVNKDNANIFFAYYLTGKCKIKMLFFYLK
jgi:hypothetical protein